jgi:molybdopterin synthase sulfur carrier subunit
VHRDLTGGVETAQVAGDTVGHLIDELDRRFPGMKVRLCQGERVRPHIAVVVNGVISTRGARQRLTEPSEIHFVPAMSGGTQLYEQGKAVGFPIG